MSQVASPGIDSTAAAISEDRLSDALALIHREGFGHNARVVRPERGRGLDQLTRAGIDRVVATRLLELERPIVLVFAPARVDAAEIVLRRGGATRVERFSQASGTHSTLMNFDPARLHGRRGRRRAEQSPND